MIRDILDKNKDLRQFLFIRGFLITTSKNYDLQEFPFYGNWLCSTIGKYHILTHKKQHINIYQQGKDAVFLIGHCLNPFDSLYNENEILEKLYVNSNSSESMLNYVNH